jgi:hypothetical protein
MRASSRIRWLIALSLSPRLEFRATGNHHELECKKAVWTSPAFHKKPGFSVLIELIRFEISF